MEAYDAELPFACRFIARLQSNLLKLQHNQEQMPVAERYASVACVFRIRPGAPISQTTEDVSCIKEFIESTFY